MVSEIWKASSAETNTYDTTAWKNVSTSPIIGFWWAFYLITNFIAQFVIRVTIGAEELSELLLSTYAYMFSNIIDIAGILITIIMIRFNIFFIFVFEYIIKVSYLVLNE